MLDGSQSSVLVPNNLNCTKDATESLNTSGPKTTTAQDLSKHPHSCTFVPDFFLLPNLMREKKHLNQI